MTMPNRRWPGLAGLILLAACTPTPAPAPIEAVAAPQATVAPAQAAPTPDFRVFSDCGNCPQMVRIPAGGFTIGAPADEPGRQGDEGPAHRVEIAKPFAISAFEIGTGEYRRFIESTGRKDVDWKMYYDWHTVGFPDATANPDLYPVAAVSWQDARDYAAWLSQRTGRHYRLPTEAEWEYVARAGDPGARNEPMALRMPAADARPNTTGQIYPVTAFGANAYGVHGLTANMGEWLEDCYVESYDQAPADGSAVEESCKRRAVRGASSYLGDAYERIANRDWGYAANHGEGIRLVRDLP